VSNDPTRPWYLHRPDPEGDLLFATQNPASVAHVVDVVAPAWPLADWCGEKQPHPPHTWGGEGWSAFRCIGGEPGPFNQEATPAPV
jgi:hypothetical protein